MIRRLKYAGTHLGARKLNLRAQPLLLVVHAYREDDHGEEIIRIISARAAEKHDIRRYLEQTSGLKKSLTVAPPHR